MKQVLALGAVGALGVLTAVMAAPVRVEAQAGNQVLASVTLNRSVMVDGKPLPAGTYQIRTTSETPKPVTGQSPDAERYVEFVRGGKVVGRELATVVTDPELKQIAESQKPPRNGAKVELLKGEDYLRVWINRNGTNYMLHLPVAKA
jgi:hypothetical protein